MSPRFKLHNFYDLFRIAVLPQTSAAPLMSTPGTPGTPGTDATGRGFAGLSASGIDASFAMMAPRDHTALLLDHESEGFDRESVAVCRVIAAR